MRVLYGVCGDGMGHAVRSSVVLRYLTERGHDVTPVASSKRVTDYLIRTTGLPCQTVLAPAIHYRKNKVAPLDTIALSTARVTAGLLRNVPAFVRAWSRPPEIVVSDFDAWSAYLAHRFNVPLISLDNVHFLSRCEHDPNVLLDRDWQARKAMQLVTDRIVPGARSYMVTTFARPLSMRPGTSLHLPILRPEVLALRNRSGSGSHLVSYFNAKADHEAVVDVYEASGLRVHHYGMPGLMEGKRAGGKLVLLPFSEEMFLDDLADSRGAVGGAGFNFLTEAFWLGKPVLAVPFGGQFEQILNAQYTDVLGWGNRADAITPEAVSAFWERAPDYAARLQGLPHDDNRELLSTLERRMHHESGTSDRSASRWLQRA